MGEKSTNKSKDILHKITSSRKFKVAGVFLLLIFLVTSFILFKNSDKSEVSNQPCVTNPKILFDAEQPLKDQDAKKLSEISSEISSMEGFENDVNCIYVLTQASISNSKPVEARKYLNLLSEKLKNGESYTEEFGDSTISIDRLEPIVKFIETQAEQAGKQTPWGGSKK